MAAMCSALMSRAADIPIIRGRTTTTAATGPAFIAAIAGAVIPTTATITRTYSMLGYYGWAYNPWAAPVYCGWGWGGSPWYGYYGGYFAPYPVYPSAAFWLTDYLIAANLQAAYAAQAEANAEAAAARTMPRQRTIRWPAMEAAAAPMRPVALSPEVKQAIADEVKAQIAAAQAEAAKAGSSQPRARVAAAGG